MAHQCSLLPAPFCSQPRRCLDMPKRSPCAPGKSDATWQPGRSDFALWQKRVQSGLGLGFLGFLQSRMKVCSSTGVGASFVIVARRRWRHGGARDALEKKGWGAGQRLCLRRVITPCDFKGSEVPLPEARDQASWLKPLPRLGAGAQGFQGVLRIV